MGFGHIFVESDQAPVVTALERHLVSRGFARIPMTAEQHPDKMKVIHEDRLRLFWISPRLGRWTGIFEFRYYANEDRDRWGYTDDTLATALSKDLPARVHRMEVLDGAGFWLYSTCEKGEEVGGRAYQDSIIDETADRSHPRYELNHLIDREGIVNIGIGYENIPGFEVRPVDMIPQRPDGIEGLNRFVHAAFERK